jgi:hypothetical protein
VAEGSASGGITSGGGFSTYYPQPAWQAAAVSGYFNVAAGLGNSPTAGYAANGRAYPDISLAGIAYEIIIGGSIHLVSGTSASCPAVAGFISNINAARLAIGKGSVGWINPTLYKEGYSFVNDITSGNNKCVSSGYCCPSGFNAAIGWDPATGLGSVNYGEMADLLVALGANVNSSPSMPPSMSPSMPPSMSPSMYPSMPPSMPPAMSPLSSKSPMTVTPSISRTLSPTTESPNFLLSSSSNGGTAGMCCDLSVIGHSFSEHCSRLFVSCPLTYSP